LVCFSPHLAPHAISSIECSGDLRALHSFPTRRSSDLTSAGGGVPVSPTQAELGPVLGVGLGVLPHHVAVDGVELDEASHGRRVRSEEHTSELQSLTNLVCRLLLEKKNTNPLHTPHTAT